MGGPGDRRVVEFAVGQAAVQDPDESVGELAQCGLVLDAAVALFLVVGASVLVVDDRR